MKPLLLHIGPHKTGTTSIQNFLFQQAARLRGLGLLYPTTGLVNKQHLGFPRSYLPPQGGAGTNSGENIEKLVARLIEEASGSDGVILSSEGFWRLARVRPEGFLDFLDRLSANFSITVNFAIRNPRDQRWSAIFHQLTVGGIFNSFGNYSSFVDRYYADAEFLLESSGLRALSFDYHAARQVEAFLESALRVDGFSALRHTLAESRSAQRLNVSRLPNENTALLLVLSNALAASRAEGPFRRKLPRFVLDRALSVETQKLVSTCLTDAQLPDLHGLHERYQGHPRAEPFRVLNDTGLIAVTQLFLETMEQSLTAHRAPDQAPGLLLQFRQGISTIDPELGATVDLDSAALAQSGTVKSALRSVRDLPGIPGLGDA